MGDMSQTDPFPRPQPVPVQSLPYSTAMAMRQGRPGLVTAIATLCIVIALMSGIASLLQGVYAGLFVMMSRVATAMATLPAPPGSVTTAPAASDALQPGEAATATNALQTRLSLDGAHTRELDNLLRTHGRTIFGIDEDTPLTAARVRESIKFSKPAGAADKSPATFATDQGTVEIHPNDAQFTSLGSGNIIQTSAARGTESTMQLTATSAVPSPTTRPASATLTAAQINQVLAAVQRLAPSPLTQPQMDSVKKAISVKNQELVTPGISTPVNGVAPQGNGNLLITFSNGFLVIGPQGQLISSMSNRAIVTRLAGGSKVSGGVAALLIGEAFASLLLAIYLLVVGIMAFRTAGKNAILLKIFALLKIPLAICAGVAIPLLIYGLAKGVVGSMATTGIGSSTTPTPAPFIEWGVGIALVGMAFPIGLLIALRAPSVREFYSAQTMK